MFAFAALWDADKLGETLTSKDPEGDAERAVVETVKRGGVIAPLEELAEVAVLSKEIFKSGEVASYTRLSPMALEALLEIRKGIERGVLVPPAIITSAPEGSTEWWLESGLYRDERVRGIFPKDRIMEHTIDKSKAFLDMLALLLHLHPSLERLAYVADTSSDIVALERAMERSEKARRLYTLYLTRFGMGIEASWQRALEKAQHLQLYRNVFMVDNALEAVRHFSRTVAAS